MIHWATVPRVVRMGSVTDVDRLFAVPLEDFVAERKQVAKELRDAGDREAAAEVAKLPKPTPPAWALNQLAREEPDAIGAWLDAAEELRDVSADPGAGLREAMAAHRDATRTLLAVVRDRAQPGGKPLSDPMLERVRALLQAATVDAAVGDALRAGRVVESDEQPMFLAGEGGGSAGGGGSRAARRRLRQVRAARVPAAARPAAAARRRAGRVRPAARPRARTSGAPRRSGRPSARRRSARTGSPSWRSTSARRRRSSSALRETAAERDAAVAGADERLEDARRALNRTESEAAAAHDAADEARDAVATAERDLRQLTRQLRSASS